MVRSVPDTIEFAESYARILAVRHGQAVKLGNTATANECLKDMHRISRDAKLDEYLDENPEQFNEIADFLELSAEYAEF